MTLTRVQKDRLRGIDASHKARGRKVRTNTAEEFTVLVQEIAALPEPLVLPKAKEPVYSTLSAKVSDVVDPRLIATFTEIETDRSHTVLKYMETAADPLSYHWMCESERRE